MKETDYFFKNKELDEYMEMNNVRHWDEIIKLIAAAKREPCPRFGTSLPDDLHVLDIGSHTGKFLQRIHETMAGSVRSLTGIEPLAGPRTAARQLLHRARMLADMRSITAQSINLVVSHEMIYFVKDLERWMLKLRRILQPHGGAFISFGSHAGNTAWRRWRKLLAQPPYNHTTYIHSVMDVVRAAQEAEFEVYIKQMYPLGETKPIRMEIDTDGWGGFVSEVEAIDFLKQKYTLILYPLYS